MKFIPSKRQDRLEEMLRQMPYEAPSPNLLPRLLANMDSEDTAGDSAFAVAPDSALRRLWKWITAHTVLAFLGLAVVAGGGTMGIQRWLTLAEAQKEFNINDATIQTAVRVYQSDHNGAPPQYFYQLTTPVAYLTGPWNPDWGKERIASDEEAREWEARPRWERDPYLNNTADWRLWQALSEPERKEWARWWMEWNTRSYFVHERFSPEQKKRVQQIGDAFVADYLATTMRLVARKAPRSVLEREQLDVYSRSVSRPMRDVFRQERLHRPLSTIRSAVREYREKYGKDPRTMGDLREVQIEQWTPGLLEREGNRPLTPLELAPLSKWAKVPWNNYDMVPAHPLNNTEVLALNKLPRTFSDGLYDWHTYNEYLKKYGPREVYDGYIFWWVDRYFQGSLPYLHLSPDQEKRVLALRDQTFQQMKAALQALVKRQASRRAFEDTTAAIWDNAIEQFYAIQKNPPAKLRSNKGQ